MPTAERFLFDNDFSEDAAERVKRREKKQTEVEAPPPPPTFSEAELAQAREDGFEAGKQAGLEEAGAGLEARIAKAAETLGDQFPGLFEREKETAEKNLETAVAVAAAIAAKMFPDLNRRHGVSEVVDLAIQCLEHLRDEPRVLLKVAPALREAVSERVTEQAARVGYAGRVEVLEDGNLAEGDCRIEWSDGGAERDINALWQSVDEIVARHLAASGDNAPGLAGGLRDAALAAAGPEDTVKGDTDG